MPPAQEHVASLISDVLRCQAELATPLAKLVHDETGGNPFFVIQTTKQSRRMADSYGQTRRSREGRYSS
jgi:hypothetical protein